MMNAPVKNNAVVERTARGGAMGAASGAARSVEKRQGRKR
jgi:hypothetical protein